jgi:hypothetical protein
MAQSVQSKVIRTCFVALLLMTWAAGFWLPEKPSESHLERYPRESATRSPESEPDLTADLDGDRHPDRISITNRFGVSRIDIDLTTRPGAAIRLSSTFSSVFGLMVLDADADLDSDILLLTADPIRPIVSWVGDGKGGFEVGHRHHGGMEPWVPYSPFEVSPHSAFALTGSGFHLKITPGEFFLLPACKQVLTSPKSVPPALIGVGCDPRIHGKRGPPRLL